MIRSAYLFSLLLRRGDFIMNVILCGYHWTGCNALEWLLEKKHNVFIYTCVNNIEISNVRTRPYIRHVAHEIFVPDSWKSTYHRTYRNYRNQVMLIAIFTCVFFSLLVIPYRNKDRNIVFFLIYVSAVELGQMYFLELVPQ